MQLAEAEQQVTRGKQAVCEQRRLVARLERNNAETSRATEILVELMLAQLMRIAHRDSLAGELGAGF
jgi:hypothetical protein